MAEIFTLTQLSWNSIKKNFENASFIEDISSDKIITLKAGYYEFPDTISPIGNSNSLSKFESLYWADLGFEGTLNIEGTLLTGDYAKNPNQWYPSSSDVVFYYPNVKASCEPTIENARYNTSRGIRYLDYSYRSDGFDNRYYGRLHGNSNGSFDMAEWRSGVTYHSTFLGQRYKYLYFPTPVKLYCTDYNNSSNTIARRTSGKNANFCVFLANCDANRSNSGVTYYSSDPWGARTIPGIDIVLEKEVVDKNGDPASTEAVDSELGSGFNFNIHLDSWASGMSGSVFNGRYNLQAFTSTKIADENEGTFYLVSVSESVPAGSKYEYFKLELTKGIILSDGTYHFGSPNTIDGVQYPLYAEDGYVYKFTVINKLTEYVPPPETVKLTITKRVVEQDGSIVENDETQFKLHTSITSKSGEEAQSYDATLKSGQSVTYECEDGASYSIREDEVEHYIPDQNPMGGTISGATKVTFINRIPAPPPPEFFLEIKKTLLDSAGNEVVDNTYLFKFTLEVWSIIGGTNRDPDRIETFWLQGGSSQIYKLSDAGLSGGTYQITEAEMDPMQFRPYDPANRIRRGTLPAASTGGHILVEFTNKIYAPPPPMEFDNTIVSGIGHMESSTTPTLPAEEYSNSVSGIGEKVTRINEITPDNVAIFRNFALGFNSETQNIGGVLDIEGSNFAAIKTGTTTVRIDSGMCFGYGYVGYCQGREITFFPPAVEQYQAIYAEIDRSVIPNKISIKTKNNQGSNKVLLNTFRQDALSVIKTGKFQVPLWFVKLSNKGIEELIDIRPLRKYIDHVAYSDNIKRISGTIVPDTQVRGDMKPVDTNDKTVATREWVEARIMQEIRR